MPVFNHFQLFLLVVLPIVILKMIYVIGFVSLAAVLPYTAAFRANTWLQMTNAVPTSTKDTYIKTLNKVCNVVKFGAIAATPLLLNKKSSGFLSSAAFAAADHPNFEAVTNDIKALIKGDMNKGPTLVRLAWHSSGTYDKMSRTGGSGKGTIRFVEELAHGANAGLDMAVNWLEPIYKANKGGTDLSYADLYTLAGVVAIKTLGGPSVPWRAGRVDSMSPEDVTPDGRLPAADKGNPTAT